MSSQGVVSSLEAYARQLGINHFWTEWDEAGHFDLDDEEEKVSDILHASFAAGPLKYLYSAYYMLPEALRRERDLRIAAAALSEKSTDACFAALAKAKESVESCPRKLRSADLKIFDGEKDVSVVFIRSIQPRLLQDEPSTDKEEELPETVLGYSLLDKNSYIDIGDRLYEDLLSELGQPSVTKRYNHSFAHVYPRWDVAGVTATVTTLGFVVSSLEIQGM